jgi:hypothetical protein
VARTILDVTADHFGEEFGPDLIHRLDSEPLANLRTWQQVVRAFTEDAVVDTRPAGQLRPYVPTERNSARDVPHGFYLRPDDFKNLEVVERGFESLKHHLLYCHSLAFDDPLPWILDMFVLNDPIYEHQLEQARGEAIDCLQFLSWIKPLIDSGAVVLVENPLSTGNSVNLIPRTDELIEAADFSDASDWLADNPRQYGQLSKQVTLDRANDDLGRSMRAITRHPDALDLYLPYRHYEQLLGVAIGAEAHAKAQGDAGQLRLLRGLLGTEVPGLDRLEVRDLVAIRNQDSAFESWRRVLEHGLNRVNQIDPESLGAAHESVRVVRQELAHEARLLEAEIDRSRFLSRVKASRRQGRISRLEHSARGRLEERRSRQPPRRAAYCWTL